MDGQSDSDGVDRAKRSVLFVDIRNSTNILENFGPTTIESTLNDFFRDVKSSVELYEGTVDKIIGDELMAVFSDSESSIAETDAVSCAHSIQQNVDGFNANHDLEISVGVGIATGKVQSVDIAGLDNTVVGRSVNIASRLQSLCKQFQVNVLADLPTREAIGAETESFGFRLIPNQWIDGIYEQMDIYELYAVEGTDQQYLYQFNTAAQEYKRGNYAAALTFFIDAYSNPQYQSDRPLLYYFAKECFERLSERGEMFNNPNMYEQHSNIQKKQSDFLVFLMQKYSSRRNVDADKVLDVGCGTGVLTAEIAEEFSTADIVGIDSSSAQVNSARENRGDISNVSFERADIELYESDHTFDIIYSNSVMHWIQNQEKAYWNIRRLIDDEGLLAVHQGYENCYKELREAAEAAIREMGISHKFSSFSYPLNYHTKQSITELLHATGFEPIEIMKTESGYTDTLVDDFAQAGLLPYKKQLDNDMERAKFTRTFKRIANDITHINTDRLYFVATTEAAE
ncbi:methyltransferase domain-containing protein [Halocatena halophila]|uniref:methyltransferase domain-containing protein n=1 Tax=Halocatena halophila TaxID=2814576 RepID=UPI002ED3DB9E